MKLDEMLKKACESRDTDFGIELRIRRNLDTIWENACAGKNKAVLAVTCTLLYKKIQSPSQDIRCHRKDMTLGFSGRGLDTRVVTPFLAKEGFPHMASGSGWLTRSLEQPAPYDMNYPGKIKPVELGQAFLWTADDIETEADPVSCLLYILRKLVDWRSWNANLELAKPVNRSISDVVSLVEEHWNSGMSGVAKLPALAIHSAYACLLPELARYKECSLMPMLSHTSADAKTGRVADIEIRSANDAPYEAAEIKYQVPITYDLVQEQSQKIISFGVGTFYILSTNDKIPSEDLNKMTNYLLDFKHKYGCQIIPNGVAATLKYYLRLMRDRDRFVREYVEKVSEDNEIPFELKRKWNEVVG